MAALGRPIKLLFLTAHALWAQSCRQSLESLQRPIHVQVVLTEGGLSQELVSALVVQPDIVLISLDNPASDLAVLQSLRGGNWDTPVLVLCSRYGLPCLGDLEAHHVQGIVGSQAGVEDLAFAIYALADATADPLVQQYLRAVRPLYHRPGKGILNPREIEILGLVAHDLTDQEIAGHLGVTVRTVNNQLHHIYGKLRVKGRAGAVVTALIRGVIPIPHFDLPPPRRRDA